MAGALLLVMAFVLPIWPALAWILAILLLLVAGVNAVRASRGFARTSVGSPVFWAILFYALHVIGMGWTTNIGFGLFDLESKAPLLVFSLLACLLRLKRTVAEVLLFVFASGGAVAVSWHVVAAMSRIAMGTGSASVEFYSSAFSAPVHPSYLALYLCVAIAAWCLTDHHSRLPRMLDVTVFLLLCTGVVLSGSKAGWLVLVMLLPIVLWSRWQDRWTRLLVMGAMAPTIGLGAGLVAFSPNVRDRVVEAWNAGQERRVDADATTSSAVRWVTWNAAITVFKQSPVFGTGTGDVKDELLKRYAEAGQVHALEKRLNAHNQFLQSAACLGLPGLLSLLAWMLVPLVRWRSVGVLAVVMSVITIANLLVESMLEVQAGTVFIGFILLCMPLQGVHGDLRDHNWPPESTT